jgi:hypothetical protein
MSFELRAHGRGDGNFLNVVVAEDERIGVFVERLRNESGDDIVAISIEDEDADLELDVLVRERLRDRHHVHLHRRRTLEVTVAYAGRTSVTRTFRANYRLKRVFDWAVGPEGFKFDPVDAGELVLAYGEPPKRANLDLHVGDLPAHDGRLQLSLVPKSFFQGTR